MFYRVCVLPFIKLMDPEFAHHLGGVVLKFLPGKPAHLRKDPVGGSVETLGIQFPNRFGLSAGFDKDGKYLHALSRRGFGHIEVGTVTGLPQPGNERPRMFRLPKQEALINRMGFNNAGAEALAQTLKKFRSKNTDTIIGVNIGKTKAVAIEDAVEDYLKSTRLLSPLADYLMINVSSPNTPGLRGLQELENLKPLLLAVKEEAGTVPVLVKIAPDLPDDQVIKIAELVEETGLNGIAATNTTIYRDGIPEKEKNRNQAGGLSGPMLNQRSLEILKLIRSVLDPDYCVISMGGVFTQQDFLERLEHGATLVQGLTGFIYRGPMWAEHILSN